MVNHYVARIFDPIKVWRILPDLYSTQTIADEMTTLDRWENLQMPHSMTVASFMQTVHEIINDLRDANELLSDLVIIHKILKIISFKFETLVRIIHNKQTPPTLAKLAVRLQMEEMEIKLRSDSHEEAFIIRIRNAIRGCHRHNLAFGPRQFDRYNQQRRTEEVECHRCHKIGDLTRDCLALAPIPIIGGSRLRTQANLIEDYPGESYDPTPEEIQNALNVLSLALVSEKDWVICNGASKHFSGDLDLFSTLESPLQQVTMATANGHIHSVEGQGEVILPHNSNINKLHNAYYVPGLRHNLMSVVQFVRQNNSILVFGKDKCAILTKTQPSKIITVGYWDNKSQLYKLTHDGVVLRPQSRTNLTSLALLDNLDHPSHHNSKYSYNLSYLWHCRLGHVGFTTLHKIASEGNVYGIPTFTVEPIICQHCFKEKQAREPTPQKATNGLKQLLELGHVDICGPLPLPSAAGNMYFLLFVDDYNRKVYIYFIKHESV